MKNKRKGFTLTETAVAGVILATAIAVSVEMLVASSAQHKAMDHGRTALLEAGNVAERLSVEPWSKLSADELAAWRLSPEADAALPGGKLQIRIEPTSDGPAGKRIAVAVFYTPKKNQPARSVRLVVWRYAQAVATAKTGVKTGVETGIETEAISEAKNENK